MIPASPAQVAAAMRVLRCRRVEPSDGHAHCDRPAHGPDGIGAPWTPRGCALAVAVADGVRNAPDVRPR